MAAPVELIVRRIYLIRSQRVMLDTHLAELYEVPTFRLNEAVKRNSNRFPEDFMFQLTAEEAQVVAAGGHGLTPWFHCEILNAVLVG